MDEKRTSGGSIVVAVALCINLLFGLYIGGYFWLSDTFDESIAGDPVVTRHRIYSSKWMAIVYEPLARLETAVTGLDVWTSSKG